MSDVQDLTRPELVCPAGTPAGLRTAVDAGADAVYCGLQNETNARNFPGLNFTVPEVEQSLAYAHARNAKLLLAVNTFPPAGKFANVEGCHRRRRQARRRRGDRRRHGRRRLRRAQLSELRLHLSVQAGASSPEAIRFYCEQFGVKRVVLPRMLTVAEIAELHSQIPCEIEAFIFGNIGMMAEGRCYLSNYVTGASTNMDGVCSPAADVHYEEDAARNLTTRLGEYVIDRFAGAESAGYPTICKGRYLCGAQDAPYYAFEEPVSLNLSALLPDLMRAGVTALKIEGRQRSRAYVKSVVGAFRKAVDDIMAGREAAFASLLALTEGRRETEGAFPSKRWR